MVGVLRPRIAQKKSLLLVFTACGIVASYGHAQKSSARVSAPQVQGQSSLKQPQDNEIRTQIYGQIRLEGMDYFKSLPESPHLKNSQFLSARISLLREAPRFNLAADIAAGTFFSRSQSNFFVNEFYASYNAASFKLYAGRKKIEWSEMDRRWQLGLWQPRQALDTLRPEEQGLVGFILDHSTDNFEILAFVSPLFIPSMGPEIRQEGGSLVSDSRWYRSPTGSFDFNNRRNSISYKLNVPEAEKLINNPGGAIMSRLGNKERGPWMVASVGYKPVNDLILKRKIFKAVSKNQVDVTVSPGVTHHQIVSTDMGYSFEAMRVSISYLQDKPEERRPERDWAIQKIMPISAYSAALDFSLDNIFSRSLAFQLGYLKSNDGGIVDILNDGSVDDLTLFDRRQKFTNVVSARVEGQLARFFRSPLVTRFKCLYDFDQKGSLVSTEFLYYPSQNWAVLLGADFLGVEDEGFRPTSFLNEFRANDRIYGGMTYVF